MKHVSYRGKHIDMELLRFKNQHQVALGNANLNARGDLLGRGGVIVKTREELLQENELELTKPDFEPVDYTQKQEKLPQILNMKKDVMDFTSEDDFNTPSFTEEPDTQQEVQEEKVTSKRAPRKSSN